MAAGKLFIGPDELGPGKWLTINEAAAIAGRLPELADRFNERFVPWARQRLGIDL